MGKALQARAKKTKAASRRSTTRKINAKRKSK